MLFNFPVNVGKKMNRTLYDLHTRHAVMVASPRSMLLIFLSVI
jgi:hypothetical protein